MPTKKTVKTKPVASPKVVKVDKEKQEAIDKLVKQLKSLVAERFNVPIHSLGSTELNLKIDAVKRELSLLRG